MNREAWLQEKSILEDLIRQQLENPSNDDSQNYRRIFPEIEKSIELPKKNPIFSSNDLYHNSKTRKSQTTEANESFSFDKNVVKPIPKPTEQLPSEVSFKMVNQSRNKSVATSNESKTL